MKKNKQINYGLIFTVIFLIGIIAIVSFAYIGYKARLKDGENIGYNILDPRDILDISGEGEDGNTIPFNLSVTLDDLDILDADNNGSSYVEDTKNVTVTLNANPETYKYPVTCEYVFKYVPEVDYTSSSDKPNGVVELGVAGENNINESFGPVSIDKADHDPEDISEDGTITLTDTFTITSNPAQNGYQQVVWNIGYRFYNLEIDQKEIVGKEPKGKVVVESLGCYASGEDVKSQLDVLLEVDPGDQGELLEHTPELENSAGDGGYRYSGNQPNNYICFGKGSEKYNNGTPGATCDIKNKYRIIGYVPVTLTDGSSTSLIKVIKAEYLTEDEFGTPAGTASVSSAYDGIKRIESSQSGIPAYKWNNVQDNNWTTSSLYTSLNSNDSNGYKDKAFGDTWLNKIENVRWNVGGASDYELTAQAMYEEEMTGQGATATVDAQIGLMYAHDYGFASSSNNWQTALFNYNNNENWENNWLFNGVYEWTLSRYSSSTDHALCVQGTGSVSLSNVNYADVAFRPVFYLKSDVKLIYDETADGSKDKPLKIELPPKTQLEVLKEIPTGDQGELIHHNGTIDVNADQVSDDAGDNGYRYSGNNPNNYICFGKGSEEYNNGTPGAECNVKNKYRIIGYVPVTLADGSSTSLIKVIKAEYLTEDEFGTPAGTASVDSTYEGIKRIESSQSGIPGYKWNDSSNIWEESTLYTSLNSDDSNGYKDKAFGDTWLNKIENVRWNVGGVSSSYQSYNAQAMYEEEMNPQDSSKIVTAQIGLMYAHDYGFASSSNNWQYELYNYNKDSNRNNNWLFNGVYEWTISRYSSSADDALRVRSTGYVDCGTVNITSNAVRPVFYLKSDVKIEGGDGSDGSRTSPLRVKPGCSGH